MRAADKGHKEIVEQLLAARAEKNAQDRGGLTALTLSDLQGHEGHEDIARLLRDAA